MTSVPLPTLSPILQRSPSFAQLTSASSQQAALRRTATGIGPVLHKQFLGQRLRQVEYLATSPFSSSQIGGLSLRRNRPFVTASATMRPQRTEPREGQESVWDYPRPPRLERVAKHIVITFNGEVIADSRDAYRVLETSHPPVYYIPQKDIRMQYVHKSPGSSFCEWKGSATYWTVAVGSKSAKNVGWSYESPTPGFTPIKSHIAFYCAPMDSCIVDGERAEPQPGGFYGGWVTSNVVGPFKGGTGSWGW